MSQANNELAERIQTMRRGSHPPSPRRAAASFNKRLHANSRPALGFGHALLDSIGCIAHKVILRAAVGEPQR